jgi:hypothetical protein
METRLPTCKVSGKDEAFSEKLTSFGQPCVSIINPKEARIISRAMLGRGL